MTPPGRAYTTRLQTIVAKAMNPENGFHERVCHAIVAIEEAHLETMDQVLEFFTDGDPAPLQGRKDASGVFDVLADALAAAHVLKHVPGVPGGG